MPIRVRPLESSINITPMVDVMLVLLIIGMIVTPIITSPARLPWARHAEARPEQPDEIVLGIDHNGVYYLSATGEGTPPELRGPRAMNAATLSQHLRTLFSGRTEDRILILKAHNQLSFGYLQDAMEIARRSGVRVLAAVTQRP